MGRRWMLAPVCVVCAALLFGGCGEPEAEQGSGDPPTDGGPSATLEIITTNIQTGLGDGDFEQAEAGQRLVAGDRVKTDATGFAELTYHDGSWQRIENNATLTIAELTADGAQNTVRLGVDVGRTWNRVQDLLEEEDSYELETPVGTASVRGTAFSTECPSATECTFTVTEGTVTITPLTGEPFDVEAIETVVADELPPEPTELDVADVEQDEWISKNLDLDVERGAPPLTEPSTGTPGDDSEEGALDEELPCSTDGTIGEVVLDGVPTSITGEDTGETAAGETIAVGRGFGFTIEGDGTEVLQYNGSMWIDQYLVSGESPNTQTVSFGRSEVNGDYTEWMASEGREDHAITIDGTPMVGARVAGSIYAEGVVGPARPPLAIDITVTCDPELVGEAIPPVIGDPMPTSSAPAVPDRTPPPNDPITGGG